MREVGKLTLSERASPAALKRVPTDAFPSLATARRRESACDRQVWDEEWVLTLVGLLTGLSTSTLDGLSDVVCGVPVCIVRDDDRD